MINAERETKELLEHNLHEKHLQLQWISEARSDWVALSDDGDCNGKLAAHPSVKYRRCNDSASIRDAATTTVK